MGSRLFALAATLMMVPFGAQSVDLVVWWEKGFSVEEDEAIAEVIDAFEAASGKQVDLALYPQAELPGKIEAAREAGNPPDVAYGIWLVRYSGEWARDDRLVDLTGAIGSFTNLFDPDALDRVRMINATTGQRALYGLPIGRSTNHVHVWKSLLEQAGFTLEDIPREWEAFWSFWCDQVQPAVREALGRDDIWGVGLAMSAEAGDTLVQFDQFTAAYDAGYVTRDGKLVIDDPEIRQRLIKVIDRYTAIYREGCTPPGSLTWGDIDNNQQFHAQAVVMTPNETLSTVNALRRERPEDYHENTRTIEWPLGPGGEAFPIEGNIYHAVVFKDGGHVATAETFVDFLVAEGWLAHYLNFSAERILPPMQALLDSPFWLDPSDRHRMAAVMQVASRPQFHNYAVASGNPGHSVVGQERIWAKAVHRVAAEGITPEQAVDEAIARIKEILSQ